MVLLLCRRLLEWQDLAKDLHEGTLQYGPAKDLTTTQRRINPHYRSQVFLLIGVRAHLAVGTDLLLEGRPCIFLLNKFQNHRGRRANLGSRSDSQRRLFCCSSGAGLGWWRLMDDGPRLGFIDDSGTVFWSWELEVGRRYRLLITTEAGLYRYDLNDYMH